MTLFVFFVLNLSLENGHPRSPDVARQASRTDLLWITRWRRNMMRKVGWNWNPRSYRSIMMSDSHFDYNLEQERSTEDTPFDLTTSTKSPLWPGWGKYRSYKKQYSGFTRLVKFLALDKNKKSSRPRLLRKHRVVSIKWRIGVLASATVFSLRTSPSKGSTSLQ